MLCLCQNLWIHLLVEREIESCGICFSDPLFRICRGWLKSLVFLRIVLCIDVELDFHLSLKFSSSSNAVSYCSELDDCMDDALKGQHSATIGQRFVATVQLHRTQLKLSLGSSN